MTLLYFEINYKVLSPNLSLVGKSKELRGLVPIFKPDASPEVPHTHDFQKKLCVFMRKYLCAYM